MVSAMTRTQAYTVDTCTAFLGFTDLPEADEPKKNVVAADTASRGLSRARKRLRKGIFITTSPNGHQKSASFSETRIERMIL